MRQLSKAELERLLAVGAGSAGLGGIAVGANAKRLVRLGGKAARAFAPEEDGDAEKTASDVTAWGGVGRLGLNVVKAPVRGLRRGLRASLDPRWLENATMGERGAAYMGVAAVPGTALYLRGTADQRRPAPQYYQQPRGPGPSLMPKQSSTGSDMLLGGGVGAGIGGGGAALATQHFLHRMLPLDEVVENAMLEMREPMRERIELNVGRAEEGLRSGLQDAVERRLAQKPKGIGPRMLHRVLR